jgi:hypothetical protein
LIEEQTMGSYFGYYGVSAERHGLTQAHWDCGWRVPYKKAQAAVRVGPAGEPFTAGVHQVGARSWVGHAWPLGQHVHISEARSMNQAIDMLEKAEAELRWLNGPPVAEPIFAS